MLGKYEAIATIAVADIGAARTFYRDTLGLTELPSDQPSVLSFKSGQSALLVYQSEFAGTNQATAVTWAVPALDGVVKALEKKGVAFESYDFPGVKREGPVHVTGSIRVAWFKDPFDNIISIVESN